MNGCTGEVNLKIISVEVGGKVLHRSQMLVPNIVNGGDGFEYVVPILAR